VFRNSLGSITLFGLREFCPSGHNFPRAISKGCRCRSGRCGSQGDQVGSPTYARDPAGYSDARYSTYPPGGVAERQPRLQQPLRCLLITHKRVRLFPGLNSKAQRSSSPGGWQSPSLRLHWGSELASRRRALPSILVLPRSGTPSDTLFPGNPLAASGRTALHRDPEPSAIFEGCLS